MRGLRIAVVGAALGCLLVACDSATPAPEAPKPEAAKPAVAAQAVASAPKAAPLPAQSPARAIEPVTKHLHFTPDPGVELLEWREGRDEAAARLVRKKAGLPTAAKDALLFGVPREGKLDLLPVTFAHRLTSDGFRIESWEEELRNDYAKKPDYQLILSERRAWPGEKEGDALFRTVLSYRGDDGPRVLSAYFFMHADDLSLFVYEAPEAVYKPRVGTFARLMESVRVGPAPKGAD